MSGYSPAWLTLREPADARARSVELVEPVQRRFAGTDRPVIRDLGCGTGSMGRWLASRLSGPQHWIMTDMDAELLKHASAGMVTTAADGATVTVETQERDVTRLTADDLRGAHLVTASALLDLLTRDEVTALSAACADAGCPALFTLSVVGDVELTPGDPLDAEIAEAFNAHQRRSTGGRQLLGPDAAHVTATAFRAVGAAVLTRASRWQLDRDNAALTTQWLRGWVGAAAEQQPDLPTADYLSRRLAAAEEGDLRAVVHHTDLLATFD